MSKDNSTGKNKDFYDLGKKIFDRLNPPGTPEFKPYFPKREWVGLTDKQIVAICNDVANMALVGVVPDFRSRLARTIEAKLKELNHD